MPEKKFPRILVFDEHLDDFKRRELYLYMVFGQETGDDKFLQNAEFFNSLSDYQKVIAEFREKRKWPQIIIFDDCARQGNNIELIKKYIADLRNSGFGGVIIIKDESPIDHNWLFLGANYEISPQTISDDVKKILKDLGY
ncbi:hypothetical protein A2331_05475 [Candidatus Falkowbacteria bacterium RIFOXYB2_FULL_34_18]|uniref:Uncharacterized protein n=1 Tax=Candidatus Falkowbacteria bacterium RIFOXYD2_FULL_34_120 TaxID=1798007 RepID=A0A1F5TRV9_9BACT|nr:MAG: hypothetical protein A2331_05475 [Candidatus Falkowbacteria bacterium RIFOXYB2_FULL_34_18]OGF29841.1 MAG: hypothetical protein A2500_01555 [Candidatus Falkowbacteria bacterium RIFOXYC12_FULL_34_55]OGF37044.1 MAG: hypothetical protein A2466_05650 [Candidatus Falkowbacteria bacterium RIFOXYC2_FULL_34_220]OGF39236.1 MAG: hypothetical protein A2515_00860 [Candidatus Falkowbacteria bacterium RIFOXYD12_FULL_34_57]OGF41341.1 MAG: hypothetical protein A2531_07070 [Candidatus Falkowbacteria bact